MRNPGPWSCDKKRNVRDMDHVVMLYAGCCATMEPQQGDKDAPGTQPQLYQSRSMRQSAIKPISFEFPYRHTSCEGNVTHFLIATHVADVYVNIFQKPCSFHCI
jgi:hypothetical protein